MDPFKYIRPYTESEVDQVLQSLTSNESVIKASILVSVLQGNYPQNPDDEPKEEEESSEESSE